MARRARKRWAGSRHENQSGCRFSLNLEPILDELRDGIDTAFGETHGLLRYAACYPLHASHR
jgi:hypothetical protein